MNVRDVLVAREGVANEDRVVLGLIQLAICLVCDLKRR
jgi:hypothetical protein